MVVYSISMVLLKVYMIKWVVYIQLSMFRYKKDYEKN